MILYVIIWAIFIALISSLGLIITYLVGKNTKTINDIKQGFSLVAACSSTFLGVISIKNLDISSIPNTIIFLLWGLLTFSLFINHNAR